MVAESARRLYQLESPNTRSRDRLTILSYFPLTRDNSNKHGCTQTLVKYFFLSEGWTLGRVWGAEGLWNEIAWRRKPDIQQMNLCLVEQDEKMWLYRVEDAVLMVEVKPAELETPAPAAKSIGQVVLKRLITGDQVVERLCVTSSLCLIGGIDLKSQGSNGP